MAKTNRIKRIRNVLATVELEREPGHIYFIDKDGDIAKRLRNPGHTPTGPYGVNHPNVKALRLGLRKRKGWLYWLEGAKGGPKRVVEMPMKQTVTA